ncbi:eukaryotic translation initiation factor 3 subunit B-like [Zophobas morio]|uniref:eukaryotic translation initiation factor 3 subunit B-like n=1 Tax=Zophobas morio TaxID=2755281 RepID=UPI003082D065
MFHDRMTSVMWNTKTGAQPCIERDHWAEQYVAWSPKGSFLATVHQQGVALWGGEYWKKIQRFEHSGVQLLDFSPCEKYIVTCNNEIVDDRDNPRAIIIWDIRTGAKLRCFQKAGKEFSWPVFKWSHDDKYVARPGDDYIAIYETPSMKTLVKGEKKTILVEGLRDASFSWSPTVRHLAFWVPEKDPHPARVALLEIPSKQIVRSKNLFNIEHATMHWHENGYYLCVKVDSKSKKGKEFSSFEIFRVKEKSIPVDTLETNEPVYAFSWEPNGHRFVVIHGHQKNSLNVTVYTMKGRQSGIDQVTRLFLIELRPFRTVVWSPKGSRFVLANLYGANRSLEFWDADSATRLNQGEHYLASRVEWDPTGRYVATYVSAWSEPTEHGYYLWTSQGRLLHRVPVPKLCQFAWRPRPKDDLSPEELKLVEKKAREWASRFDKEDREIEGKVTENERKWRRAQLAQWRTALAKVEAAKTALRESWGRVEPPPQVTQDWIEIEDEDEELLERKVFA